MSGFTLVNSNLLMFQLPGFCCKNSHIAWLLPYLFRMVPQRCLKGWLLGLSPQFVHWIKHNSQLLGCAIFFSVNNSLWRIEPGQIYGFFFHSKVKAQYSEWQTTYIWELKMLIWKYYFSLTSWYSSLFNSNLTILIVWSLGIQNRLK